MGADRKGPLAAFIVVAVIAAILLVTTVRSQAAPGWLDPDLLPATVVAAPVGEPHLWGSVTSGVHDVVHDGVVLVRKAATDSSDDQQTSQALGASTSVSVPTTGESSAPVGHQAVVTRPHHTTTHAHHSAGPPEEPATTDDGGADPPAEAPTAPWSPTHDHGRHLGWYKGHGHGVAHGHAHERDG